MKTTKAEVVVAPEAIEEARAKTKKEGVIFLKNLGLSNSAIAEALNSTKNSVSWYISNNRKLAVTKATEDVKVPVEAEDSTDELNED